jgi:uncharacterized membrane protein YbhN (UPF0104 family)
VQVIIIGLVLWFAATRLGGEWSRLRPLASGLRPAWGGVAGSAVLVLATYALLVESWRTLVRAWGDKLPFWEAARIWSVSNLGRYVPGKLWSIGAMGVMAQRAGVSPVAATGSAVIGTVVNLAASLAVVCIAGGDVARALFPQLGRATAALPVLGVLGLVVAPFAMPLAVAAVARMTGRAVPTVAVPPRALAVLIAANVASWIGYGLAFEWLSASLVPTLAGNHLAYVAVFASSYLAGYLALVVPGGLGVREAFLIAGLTGLRLTDAPTATLLAVSSRLWLTVLELSPGLAFLAAGARRPLTRPTTDANT